MSKSISLLSLLEEYTPPKFRRKDFFEKLSKYVDKDYHITFTQLNKVGVNPGTKYNTPIAVCAYPLTSLIFNQFKTNSLPFAGGEKFVSLLKSTGNGVYVVQSEEFSDLAKNVLDQITKHFNLVPNQKSLYTKSGKVVGTYHDKKSLANLIRGLKLSSEDELLDLAFADLAFADLHGVDLQYAYLYGANLEGVNLHGANLESASLESANLLGASLPNANLASADLRSANLQDANLQDANLRGANLHGADLRGANLENANLYGANLRGADLYGANLEDADLRSANLQDADLQGADLQNANLWGADLRGAKGIANPANETTNESQDVAMLRKHRNNTKKLSMISILESMNEASDEANESENSLSALFSSFKDGNMQSDLQSALKSAKSFGLPEHIGRFWNVLRVLTLKSPKPSVKWTKTLIQLGVNGLIDHGSGLLHPGEPHQTMFFSPNSYQIVGTFENPNSSELIEKKEFGTRNSKQRFFSELRNNVRYFKTHPNANNFYSNQERFNKVISTKPNSFNRQILLDYIDGFKKNKAKTFSSWFYNASFPLTDAVEIFDIINNAINSGRPEIFLDYAKNIFKDKDEETKKWALNNLQREFVGPIRLILNFEKVVRGGEASPPIKSKPRLVPRQVVANNSIAKFLDSDKWK